MLVQQSLPINVLRESSDYSKSIISCLDKVCLRCLQEVFEKMASNRNLENILLRYLIDISTEMTYIS